MWLCERCQRADNCRGVGVNVGQRRHCGLAAASAGTTTDMPHNRRPYPFGRRQRSRRAVPSVRVAARLGWR
jgi:hypothetical protein